MSRRYRRDPRWIRTRFPGTCRGCQSPLPKGARAYYFPNSRALYGERCCDGAARAEADFEAHAQDEALSV